MADLSAGGKIKLLVPVNLVPRGTGKIFSSKSEMALDFALQFTQGTNAEVYLFHVLEDSTDDFRRLDQLNVDNTERMKQGCLKAIDRLAERGLSHTIERVHRRLAHGKPGQEILQMAEGINADIIVMGAPESNAFKKLLQRSPCTIVLVKQKDY